jgi:hypothetical protein
MEKALDVTVSFVEWLGKSIAGYLTREHTKYAFYLMIAGLFIVADHWTHVTFLPYDLQLLVPTL